MKGFIIGFLLILLFLHSLLFNLHKPLSLLHGDAFLVNFILKHWLEVIFSGNWGDLFTLPMFYGFKNSLFFSDHHLIQALMALPFYLVTKNIIITSNLLIIVTIIFSFFSMYALAWYFTQKVFPSIVAAVIFVFNPFIFARFPDQLILFSLQWIPLIFLFFEKSLNHSSNKNLFLFFLFLTCQLLSSLYYSVFLSVILPLYAVVRFWQKKLSPLRLLNRGSVVGLILFISIAAGTGIAYYQVFSKEPIGRSLEKTVSTYSARVSDWFFAPPNNLIYGGLKEKAAKAFPSLVRLGIYAEDNLFWGMIPFFLFLFSFKAVKNSKYRNLWLLLVSLLIFSFLLSLGPKIILLDRVSLPGPYMLVYKINPLFSFLRTAARFGVFVFFFLGLIVAMSVSELSSRLTRKSAMFLSFLLIVIIVIEYVNKPLKFFKPSLQEKNFYSILNQKSSIKVILDLPIGNRVPYDFPEARSEDLDARYLLYATIFHSKKLFNGYTGFLPDEYYRRAGLLSVDFPTIAKLERLKKWRVDAIILHREEFNQVEEFGRIKKELSTKEVPLVVETDNLALFDLTEWKEVP